MKQSKDLVSTDTSTNIELTIEQKETEGLSQGQIVRRRFFRHRGAMISLGAFTILVLFVFTSVGVIVPYPSFSGGLHLDEWHIPGWWMWDWNETDEIINDGNPTFVSLFEWGTHPFGQDEVGRDIFARVMRGTQQSLTVMIVYGAIAAVIGIIIGGIAGYFRGWIDSVLMRLTDLFMVIPTVVFAAVVGQIAGENEVLRAYGALMLALMLGLIGWMSIARLVRGEFLTLREREFVDAARVAGASSARIIFNHILPNALGVVIVSTTLLMSAAIILEAVLSYMGFGIRPPDISLGQIVNEYKGAFATRPWLFWFPAVFIVVIALCINFIGDGLRDAFDPRQRAMPGTGLWALLRRAWSARGAATLPVTADGASAEASGAAGTSAEGAAADTAAAARSEETAADTDPERGDDAEAEDGDDGARNDDGGDDR